MASGKILVLNKKDLGKTNFVDERTTGSVKTGQTDIEYEKKRFEDALLSYREETETLASSLRQKTSDADAAILEGHLAIAEDPVLKEEILRIISWGRSSEEAVTAAFSAQVQKIGAIKDPYLRERSEDIKTVKDALLAKLAGANTMPGPEDGSKGCILAGNEISPFVLASAVSEPPAAILTERFLSRNSHLAILARALQIPMVTSLGGMLEVIRMSKNRENMICLVNGYTGEVILDPDEVTLRSFREAAEARASEKTGSGALDAEAPYTTSEPVSVHFYGNIALPAEASSVLAAGGEGVGLFRTEFLGQDFDNAKVYETAAAALGDLPLVVRTLDLGGDKIPEGFGGLSAFAGAGERDEEGNTRGIAFCLAHPDLFRPQLFAILKAYSKYKNIRILLPMVRTHQDLIKTKELLKECNHELFGDKAGQLPEVGCMIETPEAVFLADMLAEEADFFSIGSNDLLAAIAEEERVSFDPRSCQYDARTLAVLCGINEAGKKAGIPVCLCGEIAADPLLLPALIGYGLRDFSVSAPFIPELKKKARGITFEKAADLTQEIFSLSTSEEVKEALQKFS